MSNHQKIGKIQKRNKNNFEQNLAECKRISFGTRKPSSMMEDDFKSRLSVPKPNKKLNNVVSQYKQPSLGRRVDQIEKKVEDIRNDRAQSLLVNHISEIKDDIRMIKSHLFELKRSTGTWHDDRQKTQSSGGGGGEQENIYSIVNNTSNRMKSQGSEQSIKPNQSKVTFVNRYETQNGSKHHPSLQEMLILNEKRRLTTKKGLSIKTIYPMLKEYKLEGPQFGSIFYGYSKRNNQQVAIKHVMNVQQTSYIIEVYDKMWKNIAKAKWPCINRIYDYKIQEDNFIIMGKNRSSISNLPFKPLVIDIFKSLEFVHECGYLYRNIEPEHFMLNEEGQLTFVDFRRAKRYVDVKGHLLQVNDSVFNGSLFASNNQVRGFQEGRKDDLESLGYFAILLMGYDIPWYNMNKEMTIKIRSTITLQELFRGHNGWIEFMATVMRMGKNDKPDYKKLLQILQGI